LGVGQRRLDPASTSADGRARRLRAERQAGRILKQKEKAKGGGERGADGQFHQRSHDTTAGRKKPSPISASPKAKGAAELGTDRLGGQPYQGDATGRAAEPVEKTLADLGISKGQSSRWQ
jgi:hypothetical protein